MAVVDALNDRYGPGVVHVASSGAAKSKKTTWGMRQERKTPNYTTDWEELAIARA